MIFIQNNKILTQFLDKVYGTDRLVSLSFAAIYGLLASLIVNGLLPQFGFNLLQNLLAPKLIVLLVLLIMCLFAAICLIYYCIKFPEAFLKIFVLYYVLAVCVIAFICKTLKILPGSSSPLVITSFSSFELLAFFSIPTLIITIPYIFKILKTFPFVLFQLVFFIVYICYLIFHNANIPFPVRWLEGIANPDHWKLYQVQFAMIAYSILLTLLTAAIYFISNNNFHKTFDSFNKALIIFYLCEAIVTILGVPLGMFQQNVDGHVRFKSRFIHPNAYAHHLAIFLVYCLGITIYYEKLKSIGIKRFSIPLLIITFALNVAAFFLALSKGAISLGVISLLVVILMNIPYFIKNIKVVLRALGIIVCLLPLALLVIQFTKEGGLAGFIELVNSRVEDTNSFDWRTQAWGHVYNSISEPIWGHGITASSQILYNVFYHPKWHPLPLIIVHNAYYQILFDMGIVGIIGFFFPFLTVIIRGIFFLITLYNRHPQVLPLVSTLIGVTTYYLLSMSIDEVNLYDLHMLYWPFVTLVYGLLLKFRVTKTTQF